MGKRGQLLVVDESDRTWLRKLGVDSVSAVLRYKPETIAAISGSTDTFPIDVGEIEGAPAQIFVKRYRYRGLAARLAGLFRGTFFGKSRARFEYEFLTEMRRRSIPAVRPICYGEKRSNGFLKACFLITEGATAVESLDLLATGRAASTMQSAERRRLIVVLAEVIRHMHDAGIKHGGLFWRNILVEPTSGESPRLHIIDPDRRGYAVDRPLRREEAASDLADFVASGWHTGSRTDLLRFMYAYVNAGRLSQTDKTFVRAIIRDAKGRTAQESHRIAVGETIAWLRRRIAQSERSQGSDQIETIAAFFDALSRVRCSTSKPDGATRTAQFHFKSGDGSATETYTVSLGPHGVTVQSGKTGHPQLVVRTDPQAWLAIVNGSPDAFNLVRQERIQIDGDTTLLPVIAELIDANHASV